ncbi:hypothetical protein ACVWW4_000956 [Bradyrhizobium sp. LB7.1]
MVDIWRCAKASLSVSVTPCRLTPSWPARVRSTVSCARNPPSCASEETSRNSGSRRISATSLRAHSDTSAASVPVSVYWYCERLDWVEICTSCTGWK